MKKEIAYINSKDINIQKYDASITKAKNSHIYAYSWYLNIVADDWDALVLGDYEVVMPIPYMRLKRKFYKKKIVQPLYCQQLGVFYKDDISQSVFDLFYDKFCSLKPLVYSFNADNARYISSLEERPNFELKIDKPYEDIYKKFSTSLKRNIKKAKNNNLDITKSVSIDDFISLKRANKKHKVSKKSFNVMKKLTQQIENQNSGEFRGVTLEGEVLAIGFFVKSNKRLIHLFSVATQKGKKLGAMAFLFDQNINKYAGHDYVVDFEGSVIEGVARFFKSFGAEANNYYLYKN